MRTCPRIVAAWMLGLGAAASLPSLTHASELRVSSYEMSETGGIVLLESDAAIGEPWMRIDTQGVRLWFPDVKTVSRFDHARDTSDPIRGLQLRPGANDSALLRLDLGAGRKLTRSDIEVTRSGLSARVQIRFATPARPAPVATPAPPVAQPLAAAATTQTNAAAIILAAPTAQVAPTLTPPSAAAGSSSASKPSSTPAPAAISGSKNGSAIKALAAASSGEPPSSQLGLAAASGANMGGLLLLSVILCGVYLGIRAYGKKRPRRTADIQVLSARRLGARSELLVVRALGADHLLVSSAGRIERVASVPSPVEPALPEPPMAAPAAANLALEAEAASQANGLGIIAKLSSSYRVRKLLDAVDQEPAAAAADEQAPVRDSRRPAFGPELLSAIHQHKFSNLSLPAPANKQSDSVAGIARLRAGGRSAN